MAAILNLSIFSDRSRISSRYPADMQYISHEGVESIEKKTLTAGAGYSLMAA